MKYFCNLFLTYITTPEISNNIRYYIKIAFLVWGILKYIVVNLSNAWVFKEPLTKLNMHKDFIITGMKVVTLFCIKFYLHLQNINKY